MNTMKNVLVALALSTSISAYAEKDPSQRDENISDTNIIATTTLLDSGKYEYNYKITQGASNKGVILAFKLDIACAYDDITPPEMDNKLGASKVSVTHAMNFSQDSMHIPVELMIRDGLYPQITMDNEISWLVTMLPDGTISGFKFISSSPPGNRPYKLIPKWETRWWGYDEENIPEEWPWRDDFIVTGLIDGPSCPSDKPLTYAGNGDESEAISNLLVYSEPQRDRWHVDADVDSLALTIHYADNIDPRTFKAEPGWARSFFNPVPGGTDTAVLHLKKGKNLFKFSVSPIDGTVTNNKNKHYRDNVDRDVFEIRKEMKK